MLRKAAALVIVCATLSLGVSCSFFSNSNNRYVYAAIPGSSELVAFREDPNSGVLTQIAGSPISAGQTVQALALDPSGKCLYAANAGQNNVSLYTIGSDGSLTEVTPRTNVGTVPTLLALDSSGHLYVGNSGSFDISVLSVSCTASTPFSPVVQLSGATAPIGLSPLNLQLSPSGSVLYVTGQGEQGYIEAFPLSSGVLGSPVTGSPFTTGNNPYGLAINTAGTYLYTANKTDNTISEFCIASTASSSCSGPDGSLIPLADSPVGEQYSAPVSLLVDQSQTTLYAANQGSTNVAAFTIASSGGLTMLTSSPFSAGSQPSYIAGDPSGNYLFVGNQSRPAIQSFLLDESDGTLTSVGTYTVPGTPTSIVVTN
jgi:6-phosphogluconolactonase (cycloisomerase 2 family)